MLTSRSGELDLPTRHRWRSYGNSPVCGRRGSRRPLQPLHLSEPAVELVSTGENPPWGLFGAAAARSRGALRTSKRLRFQLSLAKEPFGSHDCLRQLSACLSSSVARLLDCCCWCGRRRGARSSRPVQLWAPHARNWHAASSSKVPSLTSALTLVGGTGLFARSLMRPLESSEPFIARSEPFTHSIGEPLDRRGGLSFSRSAARRPAESRPLGSLEARRPSSQRQPAPG